jgi:hypothetical protein
MLLVAAIAVAGCGSATKTITTTGANGQATTRTVPSVHFAKTKFVLHVGLAFGAFHRYIYKPLKQGAFKAGSSGRLKALVKAGVAGVFAFHELKQAHADALSDDHLRPLADRIDGLGNKLKSLAATLKSGSSNPTAILSSAGAVNALSTASQHQGVSIKDIAPALGG